MSYIRPGTVGRIVKGVINKGYVILATEKNKDEIVSYGHNKEALIEMLFIHWKTQDKLFKDWLIRELAKELQVTVRKKPLSADESIKKTIEELDKSQKLYKL